ncbi:MAG: outer membrane beta-barrel protein [Psychromonas sp.]
MKKLIISLICSVSLLTAATAVNAAKFGFGFDQGLGVTGQFDNINAFVGNEGASGDYLFAQGGFGNDIPFDYYVGVGGFAEWDGDEFGARVPLGLSFPFAPRWELFGQVSPHIAHQDKDQNKDNEDEVKFGLSGAVGLRYAF